MSEPKKYTVTDIERYHSGQLSLMERHALEKAALNDPFLADALEGYAFTQTPSADLSTLQQRLQIRVEKENKRRGVFHLNNWMKVAAMIVLVAGAGWLMSQLFMGKQQEQLATKQNPVIQPIPEIPNKSADSATVSSDAPVIAETRTTERANGRSQKAIRKNLVERNVTVTTPNEVLDEKETKTAANDRKNEGAATGLVNTASAQGKLNEIVVSSRTNDEFKKSRSASPATDTVRMNVTLKSTELPPEETVLLGKSKDWPQAKRMNVTIDTLEPTEGWASFDDYVTTHLHEPEELKEKGLKGEVELQFDVNKEGQPVNITVTQSLCSQCDEEAIRILKEGPKWKKAKKKGKIKIRFSAPQ